MIRLSVHDQRRCEYVLIDVREYPEYAAAAIPQSTLVPLASLERTALEWPRSQPTLLICRTGRRAAQAAEKLERMGFTNVALLDGGVETWQKCGLVMEHASRSIWSLDRQVRAIAGSTVVVATILGLLLTPWFFAVTLFIGSGLTFAGITDICLMATLLGKLPWNKAS